MRLILLLLPFLFAAGLKAQDTPKTAPELDIKLRFPKDSGRTTTHSFASKIRTEVRVDLQWRRYAAQLKVAGTPDVRVKIVRMQFTDLDGKTQDVDPKGTGPHQASGCSFWEQRPDVAQPMVFEVSVSMAGGKEPPANARLTWHLIDMSGSIPDIVAIGAGATIESLMDRPRVVDFAQAAFGIMPPDVDTPDLVLDFTAHDGLTRLEFIPFPRFMFVSAPETILAFDPGARDLIKEGLIKFGKPQVLPRGDLIVPIDAKSETLAEFAIIIRGARVHVEEGFSKSCEIGFHLHLPGLSDHWMRSYCLFEEGQLAKPWSGGRLSSVASVGSGTITEGKLEGATSGEPWRIVRGGYLDAIVLTAYNPEWVTVGDIWFRPAGGFRFRKDEQTRVYLVDSETGKDLSTESEATLSITEHGDLVVKLERVQGMAKYTPRLVITAARIELDAKDPLKCFGKLLIGGTSVQGGIEQPLQLLCRETPDGTGIATLREKPAAIEVWRSIARFKTD